MRIHFLPCFILFALMIAGCAAHSPVEPPITPEAAHNSPAPPNRYLWGIWKIHIDENFESVTVVRDRSTEMHLNCVRLLEVTPCTNCLSLANLQLLSDNVIQGDLVLKHPYSTGNLKLSGFDVRGIFIGEADYTWPVSGRKQAVGDDVPRMLNPDGYTTLFNPTEFPQTSPPALGYIVGNYTFGGDLTATLNPYIAFMKDQPRRLFKFGQTGTETIQIKFPEGPLEFGYAIDGCWQTFPGPCVDPVVDFPPDANCLEAYQVTTWAGPGLSLDPGAWSYIYATVYDHQGEGTIAQVTAEIPDVVSGSIIMDFYDTRNDGGIVYRGKVTNELDAPTGDYPFLVRVVDTEADQNLGQIDAWSPGIFPVRNGWVMFWGEETKGFTLGWDMETDESDNLLVLGEGPKNVDFDPTPGEDIHVEDRGTNISKYDWGGGLGWVDCWDRNIVIDDYGDFAVDTNNNIYYFGVFSKTVDFDPRSGIEERTSKTYIDNLGNQYYRENMFLLKLDPDGNFLWVLIWLSDARVKGVRVAVDGSSSIYLAAAFDSTMDFNPGDEVDEIVSEGETWNAFLTKLDIDGNYFWTDVLTSDDWINVTDLTADHSGNVVVTGIFDGIADLDPGPGEDLHDSSNMSNSYFAKFTADGEYMWANSISAGLSYNPQRTPAVAVDSGDNVYIVHEFHYLVDFDPGTEMDVRFTNGYSDCFLTKYDIYGNYLWVITWGGARSEESDAIEIDRFDNIYVLGRYDDITDFDPGPGEDIHECPYHDMGFLSRFNTSGIFQWAATWDKDHGISLASDSNGNIYLTDALLYSDDDHGELNDFDPGPQTRFCEYGIPTNRSLAYILKMPYGFNWW